MFVISHCYHSVHLNEERNLRTALYICIQYTGKSYRKIKIIIIILIIIPHKPKKPKKTQTTHAQKYNTNNKNPTKIQSQYTQEEAFLNNHQKQMESVQVKR